MWTPKRVILLALGFALLFGLYLLYAHYLGGIDGLPPLPEACLPSLDSVDLPAPRPNLVDERLTMAFGERCPELSRPIRVELHSRGLVLSTDSFVPERGGERDGQVLIKPLSLAIFKKTAPNQYPEITTVKANRAYLRFDRPINNIPDMAKAKIIGAELIDETQVVNYRGKPRAKNEELFVEVRRGSVFYQDRSHDPPGKERLPDIWTERTLSLLDFQSKPKPTSISGDGMAVFLTKDTSAKAPNAPANRKAKAETVSGVDRIVLHSNVTMHLFADSNSGFLANSSKPENKPKGKPAEQADAAKASSQPPPKDEIQIDTEGPFSYDVTKDLAHFNFPEKAGVPISNRVHVRRIRQPGPMFDQLDCDRLELQFHRKKPGEAKPAKPGEDHSVELEIETAHALGREVVLTSDSEVLNVSQANDFFYDARTKSSRIKGEAGVVVCKDGHDLEARELQIEDHPTGRRLTALGPGTIGLLDKATRKRSLTAHWNDKLLSSKDGEQDLLVLTGDANFNDEEHGQYLSGDELKVWLEANPKTQAKPGDTGQNARRPQRVEATGHVLTRSREMAIHDTDKLILTFKDGPPRATLTPAARPAPASPGPVTRLPEPNRPGAVTPPLGASVPGPAPDNKPARPIDLSAHLVEARVLRMEDGKNELDRLWTEGVVRVHQAPEKPDEKGLDIKGDTLELTKQADGNRLVVTGDLAELQIDKLFIRGPQVHIDQSENKAWVNGVGAMTMRSNRSFQGNALDHEVDMTVYWNKSMLFHGDNAEFTGSVQAEQENARLACQALQVTLDRPVSLKEGQKSGSPAKVDKMVCDRSVRVEDTDYQNGKIVKYQRLDCRELIVNNLDGTAHAIGPGLVRIHQRGDAGPQVTLGQPAPTSPSQAKKDQEMKLTLVRFTGKMWADNQSHTATFYENIETIHLPTEDRELDPDPDHLPYEAVFLRCTDRLKVYNRAENGKSNQQLEALGRVWCSTQNSIAQAEKVTYHEGKDQLIFDGGEGGYARLRQVQAPGTPGRNVEAKQIIYMRKTGEVRTIGARGINGITSP